LGAAPVRREENCHDDTVIYILWLSIDSICRHIRWFDHISTLSRNHSIAGSHASAIAPQANAPELPKLKEVQIIGSICFSGLLGGFVHQVHLLLVPLLRDSKGQNAISIHSMLWRIVFSLFSSLFLSLVFFLLLRAGLLKTVAESGACMSNSSDIQHETRIQNSESHVVGKENTQKIERKNLTLRTRIKRLVRKTICFSKKILMHDIIISLFINRYEFACANTT
jgi:hypothetical protein